MQREKKLENLVSGAFPSTYAPSYDQLSQKEKMIIQEWMEQYIVDDEIITSAKGEHVILKKKQIDVYDLKVAFENREDTFEKDGYDFYVSIDQWKGAMEKAGYNLMESQYDAHLVENRLTVEQAHVKSITHDEDTGELYYYIDFQLEVLERWKGWDGKHGLTLIFHQGEWTILHIGEKKNRLIPTDPFWNAVWGDEKEKHAKKMTQCIMDSVYETHSPVQRAKMGLPEKPQFTWKVWHRF